MIIYSISWIKYIKQSPAQSSEKQRMGKKPSTLLTHTLYGEQIQNTEVKINYFNCLAQIALYTINIPLIRCNYTTFNNFKNNHCQLFSIFIMYYNTAEAL